MPEDLARLGMKKPDRAPLCSKGREAGFRDVRRRPGEEAGTGPLRLFARTAEYFAGALRADPGYTSVPFRNGPAHAEREGWTVLYGGPPGGWDALRARGLDSGGPGGDPGGP